MRAIEFEASVNGQGMIAVPEEYKASLPGKIKVIVLYEEEDEWKRLATEQFLKGYDEGDAIYDSYCIK